MRTILSILVLLLGVSASSQQTFPTNGAPNISEGFHFLDNAMVYKNTSGVTVKSDVVLKNGIIQAIAQNLSVPKGAIYHNMEGKYLYPSFIELNSDLGMPKIKSSHNSRSPQQETTTKGAYGWNEAIKAEFYSSIHFESDSSAAKKLRASGFGSALTHRPDGIVQGTGSLIFAGDGPEREVIVKQDFTSHFSFSKGSSKQRYPSSQMGSIALLKQTFLDRDWYQNAKKYPSAEKNLTLDALYNQRNFTAFFDSRDRLELLRADKLGDEIGLQFVFYGTGDEYQRIREIKATAGTVVIPLKFPEAYDVEDPLASRMLSLEKMKHWEFAPSNPAFLEAASVKFAISSKGVDSKTFFKNLSLAIKSGLSQKMAIDALTTTPAAIIGMQRELGQIRTGYFANLLVFSGPLFEEKTVLEENWVKGIQYIVRQTQKPLISGNFKTRVLNESLTMKFSEKEFKTQLKVIKNDSTSFKSSFTQKDNLVTISVQTDDATYYLSGAILNGSLVGKGRNHLGETFDWSAAPLSGITAQSDTANAKKKDEKPFIAPKISDVPFPFLGYGWTQKLSKARVIFKNATVWSNESTGIMENTDVAISNGKIYKIGTDLSMSGFEVVDAKGMHLTAGIIDEHSHIAISKGVNEGTQASSAEVSIADVINSEDINIYRQLAGGVTAAQLLHGSANPIGGQSGLIKLRWGSSPEEMKIKGAKQYIKFALGENVKQSNWGDNFRVRFPQTRMGVEQVYRDHFTRAQEYENQWKRWASLSASEKLSYVPPRKDIEMDALLDILNGKMFITCHSYVQSEINMLMKIAEEFGFKINTFTHILEGYKVADKMKQHGAGASTFADWWAYKYEVIDAIPYNAAILNEVGVVTAINSDNAEMGRRLNQEAAKTIKYGNVSEEDAIKMVTLNPAKLLQIDHLTGSIKVGKDADIVLWNMDPLSVYAKPVQTYVDGIKYFDKQEDLDMRKRIQAERTRLMQKMLVEKKNGGPTQAIKADDHHLYHCDDIEF